MSIPSTWAALTGRWRGEYRLWLTPTEPVRISDTEADPILAARGKILEFRYVWADGGEPQAGALWIEIDEGSGAAAAAWIDSWHMSDRLMICRGAHQAGGAIRVSGRYAAPPGPDWGWRTTLRPEGETLRLQMDNLSPSGEEALAVLARYRR